jgi:hypothetical protein
MSSRAVDLPNPSTSAAGVYPNGALGNDADVVEAAKAADAH